MLEVINSVRGPAFASHVKAGSCPPKHQYFHKVTLSWYCQSFSQNYSTQRTETEALDTKTTTFGAFLTQKIFFFKDTEVNGQEIQFLRLQINFHNHRQSSQEASVKRDRSTLSGFFFLKISNCSQKNRK